MGRILTFLYGLVAYAVFFATFCYMIFFVGGFENIVPKAIDTVGTGGSEIAPLSIIINVALLGLFAIQHAIMARPWFKAWWTKIIPAAIERSTFVLATCVCVGLLVWQWRPLVTPETTLWDVQTPIFYWILMGMSFIGWGTVLYSSFLIDHFDLFGLRQVVLYLKERPYTQHPFMERSLYRWVRHPLMLGFLIAFWFTPAMTAGHLLFAIVTTGYIIVGTRIEEHDLLNMLGDDYVDYRKRTPAFLPIRKPRPAHEPHPPTGAAV